MTPRADVSPANVLVVGEALVDVVRREGEDVVHPGGSPLNVAVGLSRLGLATSLHTSLGDDEYGHLIEQYLDGADVDLTEALDPASSTSVAEATIDHTGAAIYRFTIDWDPPELDPRVGRFDAVHTGSIGAALEPGATMVESLLVTHRHTATISFDPNVRPQLMGSPASAVPRAEKFIALADVVKASNEDIAWLYPGATIPDVVHRWRALGAGLVVVTAGGSGASAAAASGAVHVASEPATVVDTIGAGDSFMAGLLAALDDRGLLGGDRRDALRAIELSAVEEVVTFAARCAAITVSRPGADPPTRETVAATYG
jgi:fructokinase